MENKKKEKTKIDIILPNFNSFEFISETVKSVLNQSYKNWKLIIVDDFSSGSTDTIYGWIDNIIRREHKGFGVSFGANKTSFLSLAKGLSGSTA